MRDWKSLASFETPTITIQAAHKAYRLPYLYSAVFSSDGEIYSSGPVAFFTGSWDVNARILATFQPE